MPKRQAAEPLEDAFNVGSPASKRARVDDEAETPEGADGASPPNNGRLMSPRKQDRQKIDILGADEAEHSEMEEAGATPGMFDGTDREQLGITEEEDEESALAAPSRQDAPAEGYTDLYLDTINRAVLDFDFEKLCSVTLSNINVYACLICGRYYQGRGPKSQAYFHALEENHHVFINMATKCVYVLPEGYEVHNKSLDDIKFQVDPKLPRSEVLALDKNTETAWDLANRKYAPGFVGMNNIKANDYFNVIMHALAHVPPLRNYAMLEDLSSRPQLAQRFGTLVRKIWNPRAFRAHVSPHELLQEIAQRSNKRFTLTLQSDPVDFLAWFLNNLHLALGGSRSKPGTSIVQRVFQGRLKVESQLITARADAGDRLRFEDAAVETNITHFLILTLDLPPAPLFQDELDPNFIPQVPLSSLLQKYDGVHAQEARAHRRRYRLLHPLPPFLLLHVKRFSANKFVAERNPTIVTFSPRALDVAPYVEPDPTVHPPGEPIWYDLVANVTHEAIKIRDDSVEGEAEKKVWRVQLRDRGRDEWFEVQDLYVEKIRPETLFTKESYLQVWERRREGQRKKGKGKAQ
ncbi:hypothetical protein BDY21DRAFT_351749 [Lineolata rhizophorae]|uniref:Uncharacterized protein n=1 Tax=Lineolata rhizophorae TaxID=578093 RepID=A0A6A6NTS7_9PEZI|nr:hypothetical protein BDY21DRAFT_351749 [Lineolata rhizophorae]